MESSVWISGCNTCFRQIVNTAVLQPANPFIMRLLKATALSGLSLCVGSLMGIEYERKRTRRRGNLDDQANSSIPHFDIALSNNILTIPTVEASSHVTPSLSSRTDLVVPSQTGVSPVQRATEIMQYGYPGTDQLKHYDNFVLSYDRRNRTAHWVFEHLRPEKLDRDNKVTDRSNSKFMEDTGAHPYFRSTNADYKNSGYDRGHLAAAGNHRHSQKAMDETFFLCNISPQVGKGFNRHIWNDLEKYVRSVGRKSKNVYVCTGPLYLPKRENDGKSYVKYEVIGQNNVAVPTHFFKVILIENSQGEFELQSFVLPNQAMPEGTKLKAFMVPVESIERAAGFLLFERFPRNKLKSINGKKQ